MKTFQEWFTTFFQSKRVQGGIILLFYYFVYPNLHITIDPNILNALVAAAWGWVVYGILSAKSPALPGVSDMVKGNAPKNVEVPPANKNTLG